MKYFTTLPWLWYNNTVAGKLDYLKKGAALSVFM